MTLPEKSGGDKGNGKR